MASSTDGAPGSKAAADISPFGRGLVLATAFLGWMLAGLIMVIIPLAGRAATIDFLGPGHEAMVAMWFSRYICAFLLGAAAGGLLFGWLGDRIGRSRAMGWSIICYSVLTGLAYFVETPWQLTVMRFLACLGVGGMWPNGVALASEAWSNVSRPILAGLIGASANLGFMLLSALAMAYPITPESWRWVTLAGLPPVFLGVFVLAAVPESPHWLASRVKSKQHQDSSPMLAVFQPPLLKYTLLGICLGAIPLLGNWGAANWLVPWAGKIGEEMGEPTLKAWAQWTKSGGGAIGALLGGWVANSMGRRRSYFLMCLFSLGISLHIFYNLQPGGPTFLAWVFAVGFFGTLFFGWLPLFLPELFPTRVRATGSGVSFNFLAAGLLMERFNGDYARVGQITCLVYVAGLIVIWFAPDTSDSQLED